MSLNRENVHAYLSNSTSFIAQILPTEALRLPGYQAVFLFEKKLGTIYYDAINPENTVKSPISYRYNASMQSEHWLKKTNMVGINVRTIGSFWHVVKYALTLPKAQNCIHLLPIWEPGVVSSLYGVSSWNINPAFFSSEMHRVLPHLNTVEKQLKVVINLLHALGFSVGMDVIPHTDRYSEQVLANPQHFEWLQRIDNDIVRHENNLHETVQDLLFNFLEKRDPSVKLSSKADFFEKMPENERLEIMFGKFNEYGKRLERREAMVQFLYDHHFETVPATMGPPYRGLEVDKEGQPTIDEKGRVWKDYRITKPEEFSRVFGPLTRFKLYENRDDNADWVIDFSKLRTETWKYIAKHYTDIATTYGMDFMRGDMAHVQMRPTGVPKKADKYYDILGFIKNTVAKKLPHFGSFAETFLAPDGVMAYGSEVAHLELSASDTTLGDLQSMVVGSPRFMTEFGRYLDILHNRKVAPNFTVMTGDKDDPRFDEFYLRGNEARFFIALFLPEMPSYTALGFELRDPHPTPAPNEHYTKLYVFHLEQGKNATHGEYVWGTNQILHNRVNRMRLISDWLVPMIKNEKTTWLRLPSADNARKVIAWTVGIWVFVVNLDTENDATNVQLDTPQSRGVGIEQYFEDNSTLFLEFTTLDWGTSTDNELTVKDLKFEIERLQAGESRIYRK
jgi:hypothetical protein